MQQQITQQSNAAIAPEPTRNVVRAYWIVFGFFLALLIGSFFLPEPLHDELLWHQSSPFYLLVSSTPLSYAYPFVWYAIFIWPFMYFPAAVWPARPKWKTLEKNRRRAVENRLSGRSTATFSLPEVFPLLPASLSVRVRRNWHATLIAGTIYTTLIGFVLLAFVSDWQFSIQSLARGTPLRRNYRTEKYADL